MFVIIRNDDGKFVAKAGSLHSYTEKLQQARTWPTRWNALQEACENERVVSVEEAMARG